MATQPQRIILTYDDYAQMPNDGKRYELFEGEIYVAPAPNIAHQIVVINLAAVLQPHIRRNNLGMVFVAPCDVLLSDITVVQPDLLFVAREHQAIILPAHVRGSPDLVVEVISPSTTRTDREVKRQLYERYRVTNYWLFDPERREAVAFQLRADTYHQVAAARESEVFAAPPFPDLPIPLDQIWG